MHRQTLLRITPPTMREGWITFGLVIVALCIYLVGITHDLPFITSRDEYNIYARASVQIAATHDLRPLRLSHPASTIFYPLALIYKIWHVIAHQGMLFRPDPYLMLAYELNPGPFLLLGRLLSVLYGVIALPLVYHLGKKAANRPVGVIGAWFLALTPILVVHTQSIRDDSATVLFSTLSMIAILRVHRHPSLRNQALAGTSIGLAISTKYYLGLLIAMLLAIDLLALYKQRQQGYAVLFVTIRNAAFAGLMACLTFVLTTPYFVLDWDFAQQSLGSELRGTHLGADGLSPYGNFLFYFSTALPQVMTLPRALLAMLAIALTLLWRPNVERMLFLGYALAHVLGISVTSALHWPRWIFPALPAFYLLSADALFRISQKIAVIVAPYRMRQLLNHRILLATCAGLLSVWPLHDTFRQAMMYTRPSTMVQTRYWLLANLPETTSLAIERYTAPLELTGFRVFDPFTLADCSLDDLRQEGYEYLLTSSFISNRYYADPERYAKQVAFYEETLPQQATLLHVVEPVGFVGGPIVRIYKINAP